MDDAMGNITGLLKEKTMYNDTIIFFLSDNGGASFAGADHTGNNFPLRRAPRSPSAALPPRPLSARADPTVRRGTKMHNWQGGIRVNAFVSGGWLASAAPRMVRAKLCYAMRCDAIIACHARYALLC
jgi:arylsulfatase I/J